MKIQSLRNISSDTIFQAFNQAFADYEMQLNKEQLRAMLTRRGFNPDLSFAAFHEDKIVAFTLNGIGNYNGLSTAYDTGTGTLKEYRGQGLATKIFEYSIPHLKENNICQYLLEVLQHNTKAVSVYTNLGFKVSREFYYFMQENGKIENEIKNNSNGYLIRQVDIEQLGDSAHFWDFYPSWQNSFDSIKRTIQNFICFGAYKENKLVGYCVFEPNSGDLTQIAVDKQHRRKGIASLLLIEASGLNKYDTLKVINTDVICDSITGFFQAKNIDVKGKQFEMIKEI